MADFQSMDVQDMPWQSILWHADNLLVLVWIVGMYFVPSLIAVGKRKRNVKAFFVVNLLLGWTLFVWVLAFVWAMNTDVPAQRTSASLPG